MFVVSRLLCVITSTNRFRLTLSNEERKKHAKMCMEKFNRNFTLKKSKLHQWIRAMNFQCEFSGCIEILTLSNFARKVFSSAFVIRIFLLLLCCYCRCHKKKSANNGKETSFGQAFIKTINKIQNTQRERERDSHSQMFALHVFHFMFMSIGIVDLALAGNCWPFSSILSV